MSDRDETASVVEGFHKQADIARHRQAWDDVVKIFQVALKQVPQDRTLMHGLASAYVAKADRAAIKPMYLRALEEYWKLVNGEPSDVKAHEGLLTAAVKADRLAEVMEEYRARIARGSDAEHYKAAFKKIQTLYLLKADVPKTEEESTGRFFQVAFGRVSPFIFLVCLIGWFLVRLKVGVKVIDSPRLMLLATVLARTALVSFVLSLVYFSSRLFRSSAS